MKVGRRARDGVKVMGWNEGQSNGMGWNENHEYEFYWNNIDMK